MLTVFKIMSKQMQSNKENEKLMRTNERATIISVSVFIKHPCNVLMSMKGHYPYLYFRLNVKIRVNARQRLSCQIVKFVFVFGKFHDSTSLSIRRISFRRVSYRPFLFRRVLFSTSFVSNINGRSLFR